MKKVKVIFIILLILAGLAGSGWYVYSYKMQKHYLIAVAEKFVSERMKSPSSYKTKEILFGYNKDSKILTMAIKYEAANSFGALIQDYASFKFQYNLFGKDDKPDFRKALLDATRNKLSQKTPFEEASLISIEIGNTKISEIDVLMCRANMGMAHFKYKGLSLGGKILSVNDDGSAEIEYGISSYEPDKFFPYKITN